MKRLDKFALVSLGIAAASFGAFCYSYMMDARRAAYEQTPETKFNLYRQNRSGEWEKIGFEYMAI
ncbi:MAG: hypothetical protein HY518_03520 [Candidatus Aenigmarchaeota archaeon]|nr:hypothetical protein [Candidatus Aenigmarchaeota archaeon]